MEADVERLAWLLRNPETAQRFFFLLQHKKGNEEDFRNLVDRMIEAEKLQKMQELKTKLEK